MDLFGVCACAMHQFYTVTSTFRSLQISIYLFYLGTYRTLNLLITWAQRMRDVPIAYTHYNNKVLVSTGLSLQTLTTVITFILQKTCIEELLKFYVKMIQ